MADVVALRTRPSSRADAAPTGGAATAEEATRLADVRPLRGDGQEALAHIRAAGLVRPASEPEPVRTDRFLPVISELRPVLPGGGLRRGTTVAVLPGSTSLLIALLVAASTTGSWCAVVGLPGLGLIAAAEAGVALDRLTLVPQPGPDWPAVVAALLDGVDIVVAAPPGPVTAKVASRLAARARQRGTVLIPYAPQDRWPGADLTVQASGSTWHGLGEGRGRLRRHDVAVTVTGRGAAGQGRTGHLHLPRDGGAYALPGGGEPRDLPSPSIVEKVG